MSRLAVFFFLLAALALPAISPRKLDEIIQNKCIECYHPPPPPHEPDCPPPPLPPPPPHKPDCPPPPLPPPPIPLSPPPPIPSPPIPPIVPSPPPPIVPSPPPPPVVPAPPPPPFIFSPPPPPTNGSSGNGGSLYITSPDQLYPVDYPYSAAAENRFAAMGLLPLLIGGVLFITY